MPSPSAHLHGLLVVDKPGLAAAVAPPPADAPPDQRLPTSHDVVQRVRRWSGERRIGHTGTLDPLASGVLVLCLGQATRLVEYYQGHRKQYYAEVLLGAATDTYDRLGQVTAEASVPALNDAQIEIALRPFRGSVLQSPPAYSALKQGGESVHRKARRGETVVLAPRPVTFYQLDLLEFSAPNRLCLRLVCSAGAYVRSLAHDLGQAFGTCGHLAVLRREAAGPFSLAQAHELPVIEAAARQGRLAELLLPPGFGLELPRLTVLPAEAQRLGYGQKVPLGSPGELLDDSATGLAQAYAANGLFLGIIRCVDQEAGRSVWKAEKWFGSDE
ncbi:MAG TPA: tRNA pseudouridine(55) synthase TruB [Caldilineaceae bacterium]|nr:tRNA pseudouridine(55) synthase TruB [Caldilineaceae bacterium]